MLMTLGRRHYELRADFPIYGVYDYDNDNDSDSDNHSDNDGEFQPGRDTDG